MTSADPLAIAAEVARAFELAGVRYLLGGSLASTTFGEPRATLDVDFAADLTPATLEPWADTLAASFVIDRAWARSEVAARRSFQILHRESALRVDVFVPPWQGLDLWKWEQRVRVTIRQAAAIDVTAPAGIVLQKLRWFRAGGEVSDRQWRDVLGVLKTHVGKLDRAAMASWASRIGVDDLLQRAEREAGWPPRRDAGGTG